MVTEEESLIVLWKRSLKCTLSMHCGKSLGGYEKEKINIEWYFVIKRCFPRHLAKTETKTKFKPMWKNFMIATLMIV